MVAVAENRNIATILATFAHSNIIESHPLVASDEGKAALAEMNQAIKSIASNTPAHLLDFAARFPDQAQYYCSDGIHVTAEGVKVKAKIFADYIVDNRLLPASGDPNQ